MADVTGYALSKGDAMTYANEHDLVFIKGWEILEAWQKSDKRLAAASSDCAKNV